MASTGTRAGLRRTGARIGLHGVSIAGRLAEAAFGVLLAAGLAVEAAAMVSRRPAWPVGAALVLITAAVCGAALLRRRFPAPAVAAAIVLCGAAELIDWRTDRHGQPAPVACLALLVVVASTVRSLPRPEAAVAVAAGSGVCGRRTPVTRWSRRRSRCGC